MLIVSAASSWTSKGPTPICRSSGKEKPAVTAQLVVSAACCASDGAHA
jgi:hypothetical protein